MSDPESILTDEEGQAIMHAALIAAGSAGLSEDDANRITQWAVETKINSVFLREILKRRVGPFVAADGELRFKTINDAASGERER
jgi:hypothetical protein